MLRIGLIGCGKIADSHALQVGRLDGAKLVAVCDSEPLMAEQLRDRFRVDQAYSDVGEMLEKARLDVVHITTPPQGHFGLARQCLEAGCHVYVEKPFTLNTADAVTLFELARKSGRLITAGHDDQFTHVARRMRKLIRGGYLGGAPVHMESYYCYELGDGYARSLLHDPGHWIRRLPGGLLQNIISHGIARIAEYCESDRPLVRAEGFVSPRLKAMGETRLIDELRVMVFDGDRRTGYFTFSTQIQPCLHEFRIFGPRNGLHLDHDKEILVRLRGGAFKSYAEKFVPPMLFAKEHLGNLATNLRSFIARDFHMKSGMRYLVGRFYEAIREGGTPPIPEREILLVSRIMDDIFAQIGAEGATVDGAPAGPRSV